MMKVFYFSESLYSLYRPHWGLCSGLVILTSIYLDRLVVYVCLLIRSPKIDCSPPLPVVLPASSGQGLQISAQLTRQDGQVFYSMLLENNSQSVLDGFMIQFNKNSFGLAAAGPLQVTVVE